MSARLLVGCGRRSAGRRSRREEGLGVCGSAGWAARRCQKICRRHSCLLVSISFVVRFYSDSNSPKYTNKRSSNSEHRKYKKTKLFQNRSLFFALYRYICKYTGFALLNGHMCAYCTGILNLRYIIKARATTCRSWIFPGYFVWPFLLLGGGVVSHFLSHRARG